MLRGAPPEFGHRKRPLRDDPPTRCAVVAVAAGLPHAHAGEPGGRDLSRCASGAVAVGLLSPSTRASGGARRCASNHPPSRGFAGRGGRAVHLGGLSWHRDAHGVGTVDAPRGVNPGAGVRAGARGSGCGAAVGDLTCTTPSTHRRSECRCAALWWKSFMSCRRKAPADGTPTPRSRVARMTKRFAPIGADKSASMRGSESRRLR